MLIAYVDESYDHDLYFVGAAIAEWDQWEYLAERYVDIGRATAELHGTEPGAEFHGHEIMGGAGQWAVLRGKHRETAGFYAAVLRAASEVGVRYLFEGVDVVADQIATSDDHQEQFRAYQEIGTGGDRPSKLSHISAPINFADSRLTPGLQAIDMAVYIHRRFETVREQHPRAQATTNRLAALIYQDTLRKHTLLP